jgi:hypothetical protein
MRSVLLTAFVGAACAAVVASAFAWAVIPHRPDAAEAQERREIKAELLRTKAERDAWRRAAMKAGVLPGPDVSGLPAEDLIPPQQLPTRPEE